MTDQQPAMATSNRPTDESPDGSQVSPGDSRRTSALLHTSVHSSALHHGDHALTRLVRRLEAATSRLEDIASSSFDGTTTPSNKGAGAGGTGAAVNGVPSETPMGGVVAATTSQDATPKPSIVEEPKEEVRYGREEERR